jgi:hypothetical protein
MYIRVSRSSTGSRSASRTGLEVRSEPRRSRPVNNFGETAELFDHPFEIKPKQLPPGLYRQITGNVALLVRPRRGRAEG